MGRGRIPTPKAVNDLKGDPSRRRRNQTEPTPTKERPVCPDRLNHVAKEEWTWLVDQLEKMGMLSGADAKAIELYATSAARLRKYEQLCEDGLGIMDGKDSGFPVMTGYHHGMTQAWDQVRKLLIEFGLTPAARSRMAVPTQPSEADAALMSKYVHRKR